MTPEVKLVQAEAAKKLHEGKQAVQKKLAAASDTVAYISDMTGVSEAARKFADDASDRAKKFSEKIAPPKEVAFR
jgi:hypothetical protein